MSKKTLVLLLVLYIASAGISFGGFSAFASRNTPDTLSVDQIPTDGSTPTDGEDGTALSSLLTISPSEPKDQPCPLNGQLYTATEKAAWEKRRPLAVMIENTPDARPQSGLSKADVTFEIVAEGGVTRFMSLFYCGVQQYDTTLGPVRSARTYFVDYASGFNRPLYAHVGGGNLPGPADALGQIREYGWHLANDVDAMSVGYPTFIRDYNRLGSDKELATEHTMVSSTEKLFAVGDKRGWTNMSPAQKNGKKVIEGADWKAGYTGWTFDEGKPGTGASTISYEFWSGYNDYAVEWKYDAASNSYLRSEGGATHIDLNNNQQLSAKNIVVLLTTEKGPIDEKKHMLYGTTGTGDALIFKNGEAPIKATWNKKTRESELEFEDKGKPVTFTRGEVWVSVVNKATKVAY